MSFTIADHAKAMRELVDYYEEELKKKNAKIADLEMQLAIARNTPITMPSIPTIDNAPTITWDISTTGNSPVLYEYKTESITATTGYCDAEEYVGKHDSSVDRKG